ncbi:MAG: hypothetical protein WCI05_17095 [Myxococcales bacterium]|jgi:hypothetical protein
MLNVEQTAKLLATEHLKEDEGIRKILWAPAHDEVRLIDVTTSVSDRGEVLPFRFNCSLAMLISHLEAQDTSYSKWRSRCSPMRVVAY